jgi:hypothetical protein
MPPGVNGDTSVTLPAGQFDALDQEIEWYSTSNEASFYTDFENVARLVPSARQVEALSDTLDQVVAWTEALAPLRK